MILDPACQKLPVAEMVCLPYLAKISGHLLKIQRFRLDGTNDSSFT